MIRHNLGHSIKGTPKGWQAHHSKFWHLYQDDYKHIHRLTMRVIRVLNKNPIDLQFNQPEWWYQSLLDGKHALEVFNSTIENDANLVSGLRLRRWNFTESTPKINLLPIDPSFDEII